MQNENPFKAPDAAVADQSPDMGEFIPEGRGVPAGNGVAWLQRGWELFRMAPGPWVLLCIVYLVVAIVLGMIPVVNFLFNLAVPIFTGGIMLGCKALEDGEELTVGHLFAGFSGHAGNLALVGLIYLVGVVAVVIVMALLMGGISAAAGNFSATAMIIPVLLAMLFIIPLAMAMYYAPALIVFHGQQPLQAMKASFFVSLKNIVPFLVYGLVVIVLAIVASLPLFLGWLVLIPVLQASIYASYKDMFTNN